MPVGATLLWRGFCVQKGDHKGRPYGSFDLAAVLRPDLQTRPNFAERGNAGCAASDSSDSAIPKNLSV